MECVGGVGHGGCPVRCSQDSHPPRTYRVHSAYSRPQKGDEGPARAWPAAIWGPAPGPAAQCVISKQFCGVCMEYGGNLRRICEAHFRNMYGISMEYLWYMY